MSLTPSEWHDSVGWHLPAGWAHLTFLILLLLGAGSARTRLLDITTFLAGLLPARAAFSFAEFTPLSDLTRTLILLITLGVAAIPMIRHKRPRYFAAILAACGAFHGFVMSEMLRDMSLERIPLVRALAASSIALFAGAAMLAAIGLTIVYLRGKAAAQS